MGKEKQADLKLLSFFSDREKKVMAENDTNVFLEILQSFDAGEFFFFFLLTV